MSTGQPESEDSVAGDDDLMPESEDDDDFEDVEEESGRSASVLTEDERHVMATVAKLGIQLSEVDGDYLIFEQRSNTEGAGVRRRRTSIPRSSVNELAVQLSEERVPHSTMVGFAVSARGYLEVLLDLSGRRGAVSPLMADRILELAVDDMRCIHTTPEHELFSIPYEPRYSRSGKRGSSRIHLASTHPARPCVEISNISPMAKILYGRNTYMIPPTLTVKIAYEGPRNLDDMIRSSDELIRSLLYEMDVRNGYVVDSRRLSKPDARASSRRWTHSTNSIRYPRIELQYEVSDLFNFASQANDNPPLAFLSYYQALEYFIPAAVRQSVLRKVRKELRDPMFDERSDSSLIKIVSATERSMNQPEIGQLRVLVNDYARAERLSEFFGQDWGSHFQRNGPIGGVEPINPSNTSKSLSDQVADRIYQIRNRIVHAKDDPRYNEARVLLPRSPEAEALGPDVQLVRLVAMEAILAVQ